MLTLSAQKTNPIKETSPDFPNVERFLSVVCYSSLYGCVFELDGDADEGVGVMNDSEENGRKFSIDRM